MKYLIVVDFQNDFITGALGNKECEEACVRFIADKDNLIDDNTYIIYTKDTHYDNYMDTIEGQNLPVPHCIDGTFGHELADGVLSFEYPHFIQLKQTFGSINLVNKIEYLISMDPENAPESITIVGVCTDICVISNAMILKAAFPNVPITVLSNYCAGTNIESHERALEAMKMCHIEVV